MIDRPDALLLDAGNTFVFLDHAAVARAALGAGVVVSAEALARAEPLAKRRYEAAMVSGVSHEDGWALHMRALFACAGVADEATLRATEAARAEHDTFNLWRDVPRGLAAHLARARSAGLRLGVISNSEGQLTDLLVRLDLASLFETVVDSGVEGIRKPDPAIFALGLARMGLTPTAAVYAGDIPHVDVDGARAAGLGAVLIDTRDHYPHYSAAPRFSSVTALLHSWHID